MIMIPSDPFIVISHCDNCGEQTEHECHFISWDARYELVIVSVECCECECPASVMSLEQNYYEALQKEDAHPSFQLN